MKKVRDIQRKRRHMKEQLIKLRDICGIKNPTPFEAVGNMVRKERGVKAG